MQTRDDTSDSPKSSWRRSSAVLGACRVGLIALAVGVLLIMVGCSIDHGITRVGTTEQKVIAEALRSPSRERATEKDFTYFLSEDGGATWSLSHGPTDVQWSEGPVHTPRGTFSIQGPDIMLTTHAGEAETIFSAADWRTPSNRWFQRMRTHHLIGPELSNGPIAIAYEPVTRNVIAAAGIMGVVVGTPNEQWTGVAVGEYTPVEFSRIAKLKTLLSHNIFWATVVTFPFLMIALAFSFKAFIREGFVSSANPEYDGHGDTTAGLSHGLLSQPESSLSYYDRRSRGYLYPTAVFGNLRINAMSVVSLVFLFVSLFSLVYMWVLGSGVNGEGWSWWPVAILVGASVLASMAAWRGQWKVHWGRLAGSYLAMAAFVALPFVIWVQTGLPLAVPKTLAIVLCIATAAAIYMRLKFKPLLSSDSEKAGSAS